MASIGYGSTMSYETTPGGGSYTAITEVVNIKDPEIEVGEVDVSHLASTNQAMEYTSGMIKGGDCEFELLFAKAVHTALYALILTTRLWKITFPTTSTLVFSGFLKKIRIGQIENEKPITSAITVKVTGKPTYTAN